MAWARWAVAMLAAAAGALMVLLAPLDQLEATVWTLGLRNLVPQLNPPLGDTARFGLAASAALLAAVLVWLLLALLGAGRSRAAGEELDVAPAPAWRRPADPSLRAMPAAAGPDAALPAMPVAEPVRAVEPVIARGSVAMAVTTDTAVTLEAPGGPAEPAVAEPAAAVPVGDGALAEAERSAMLASLARIEAQLAEARQGPVVGPNAQLIARFEDLDARLCAQVTQIAQQLVEVAQLARMAARAPAVAAPALPAQPLATLPVTDAARQLPTRPARRPVNRSELAAAIRNLRAALDAGPGLGGHA